MLNRRQWLFASTGALGCSSIGSLLLAADANVVPRKNCILIWLDGGPSQLDTLDPKPNAPDGHGGPLRPTATAVPGIQIAESLPKLATLMGKCAVIRSMSTKEKTHGNARFHLHTGYLQALTIDFPSIGAVVSYSHRERKSGLPRFVHLGGGDSHGCSSGFLGARHSPLKVTSTIPFLDNPLKPPVFQRRIDLLRDIEANQAKADEAMFRDHRESLDQAVAFMESDFSNAFDLNDEPDFMRQRFGKSRIGNACLRARRLIESGVSFVEINSTHWDMHAGIYNSAPGGIEHKTRELDVAISAIIEDLDSRGLLEETLLVWMGEFGRTPKIVEGANPGRDHYAQAWSTMLIGGGITGGQVIGKTDVTGQTVTDRPVSAADFLATIYQGIGLDHSRTLRAPGNRPVHLVDRQDSPQPIEGLF